MTTALLGFALAATVIILAPGPDFMLVMRNTMRGGRRAGLATACGTLSGLAVWALAAALGLSALLRVSHVGYDILRLAGAAYLIWLGVSSLAQFRGKEARAARRAQAAARAQAVGVAAGHPGQDEPEPAGHARPGRAAQAGPEPPGRGGAARHARLGRAAEAGPERSGGAGTGRLARPGRAYLNGVLSNLLNPKISVFFIAFLPAFVPAGASTVRFSLLLGGWFIAETGLWLASVAWLADRGARWLRRSAVQRWLERVTGVVLIGFGLRLATESRRLG